MFRSLTFFRFDPAIAQAFGFRDDLDNGAAANALKPVGSLELSSRGWIPRNHGDRIGHEIDALPYYLSDDVVLLTLGGEDKVLPSSAVNAALQKRIQEFERAEGRKPGARARKALRESILDGMLPRALVKPYRLDGYLDLKRGLVVVDTASRKAAEEWVGNLRATLGSFPALPVNAEADPRMVLTCWLAGDGRHIVASDDDREVAFTDWALGDECQMQDATDRGGVVTIRRQELDGEEVREHLQAGKQCTRLGLYWGDRISFTLGEDLVVRKLRFLDGAMDQLEAQDSDDLQAELDARATLLVGEVGRLFDTLEQAFRISKVEG